MNLSKRLAKANKELGDFLMLKEVLAKIVSVPRTLKGEDEEAVAPSEISVSTEQPALSVKVQRKPLNLTDEDLTGKIAIVYAEGKLGEGWFTVTDVNKAFHSHGWPRDPRASKFLDQYAQWGYLEKKFAGKKPMYHVRMKPEEAKAKGLLKVEE